MSTHWRAAAQRDRMNVPRMENSYMRIIAFLLAAMALAGLPETAHGAPQWPQCTVRSGGDGAPAIFINGEIHAPLLFVGNNHFGRDDVLVQELQLAAEAGIKLFGFGYALDWHTPPEKAAAAADRFCAAHPEGYFLVRIWLGPNREWCAAHPDDCITKADGARIGFASPSSEAWRTEACERFERRLREIIDGPHGNRFFAVVPAYLQTSEWFYPDTNDFMDYSPANLRAFRTWLKQTYRSPKRLREAWNDDSVTFETAQFPTPEAREAADWGPFRDPAKRQPAIDIQRFQSETMADTIAYFARAAKRVTKGRSLTGAFYGYTMELNNNGRRALTQSGHLAFGRLLECNDIDLIHAPYSYLERASGDPGHFHLPVDSVALHGKLAIIEEDTFTHLSRKPAEGLAAPGWNRRTKSLAETLSVSRRNYANFLTHRSGLWFFDLLSDGRWNDPEFWKSTALLRRMAAELRGHGPFQPEVAFIIDENSVHYLRAATHPWLLESLSRWRSELDRLGTPVGYYLQSDLPRLPTP